MMLNKAERLLPLDNYEGEFGMEYLWGLGYFMGEGRIQDTEGYSENAEPDLDKYDQGGYAYLKVLMKFRKKMSYPLWFIFSMATIYIFKLVHIRMSIFLSGNDGYHIETYHYQRGRYERAGQTLLHI